MKVYLAAAWSKRLEISQVADRLRAYGVIVTSRWLEEESTDPRTTDKEDYLQERAEIDLQDIDEADVLIRFTDTEQNQKVVASRLLSGARMVEFGYALGKGKRVFVVGGAQNIFDRLSWVTHFITVDKLIKYIRDEMYL